MTIAATTTSLLLLIGFPLPYILNNYRLDCFAGQLAEIPPPLMTERIGRINKKFGNLGTCSKHGDYYAEFRIASKLPLKQLKDYYDQFHIQIPRLNKYAPSFIRGLGTHGPIEIDVDIIEGVGDEYLISAFDPDYWPNDFRCW
ncbi:MAG: hypothetical protein WC645_05130 [Candidatus Margulisiibacteriota bacterium]